MLLKYNSLSYERKEEKQGILKEMFGSIGMTVSVGHSFLCDYSCKIHIGNNLMVNMGCTFVDCNRITIGSNVLIAPNVQIYTATHPIDLNERLTPSETTEGGHYLRHTYALPVTIGDGCWIGGGVVILPGVTIGEGSVIGAGNVVTKDIPTNCLAADIPVKAILESDLIIRREGTRSASLLMKSGITANKPYSYQQDHTDRKTTNRN